MGAEGIQERGEDLARNRKPIWPANSILELPEVVSNAKMYFLIIIRIVSTEIHEEDISAIVEESNFDGVRKSVNQNVNLQHPIIVDQYDVCQLVHDKELKKITINMMGSCAWSSD